MNSMKHLSCLMDELLIPLKENDVPTLDLVVAKLLEDVNCDVVAQYSLAIISKKIPENIKERIVNIVKEDFPNWDVVYIWCITIALYKLIVPEDGVSIQKQQAIYSLILRNSMIIKHGHFNEILFQDLVAEMVCIWETFWNGQSFNDTDTTSLENHILSNKENDNLEITQNDSRALRKLVLKVRETQLRADIVNINSSNEYETVCLLANKMISDCYWHEVYASPASFFKENVAKKELLTFQEIITMLLSSEVLLDSMHYNNCNPSSIILRAFKGDPKCKDYQNKMNPLTFAIYIYQEMLLEKLINK